jgi:predicted NBD/HSP70 family sugar kinase
MIKASVVIAYSDEITLFVRVLFIKIPILPKKEPKKIKGMSASKAKKIRKQLEKKAQKKALSAKEKEEAKKNKQASKKKKSAAEIIAIIQMVSDLAVTVIERFARHLRIRIARIKLVIASEDAATTALLYGTVTQSINLLFPVLERVKNFPKLKDADISVDCDFASTEPEIDIMLGFSIRVWQVLHIAISALITFIKHQLKTDAKSGQATAPNNKKTTNK